MRDILLSAFISISLLGFSLNSAKAQNFSHSYFDGLLRKHVDIQGNQSLVDYNGLAEDRKTLDDYTRSLSAVSKSEFDEWSEDKQLSFLINAYNAFTLQLVLDHYPVKSIKDIGGPSGSPWKKEFFELLGTKQSLDYLEHELIRKNFNEPRIHFALVCAAVSCPPLKAGAYVGHKLDKQLEEQTKNFLADNERNRFLESENKVELSKIFSWFEDDFLKKSPNILNYLTSYMPASGKFNSGTSVTYMDYDWSLNDTQ